MMLTPGRVGGIGFRPIAKGSNPRALPNLEASNQCVPKPPPPTPSPLGTTLTLTAPTAHRLHSSAIVMGLLPQA